MSVVDFHEKSLVEIGRQIQSGEVRGADVAEFFLKRAQAYNSKCNAFISINTNLLDEAEAQDKVRAKDQPLRGIPLGIKDMICTEGVATTAGSRMLKNFVPPYSATLWERLRAAGALALGKCNQDEFAMGSSNENSFFGATKNPWNDLRVTGGSSGGSAAAVAAGLTPGSIGTDTGGSIRLPANFCGVVGLKPTYGRVSRYGVIAYASSLDQAGPLAKTVEDVALLYQCMAGHDAKDATSSREPIDLPILKTMSSLKGVCIGKVKEFFSDQVDVEVKKQSELLLQRAQESGAKIIEVSLSHLQYAVETYYLIATSEASSNLSRYDGIRYGYRADFADEPAADLEGFYSRTRGEGFGEEVKRRIMLGTFSLSGGYYDAYYLKASRVRRLILEDFKRAFSRCDLLFGPVATDVAFTLGEKASDPLQMYYNDVFTTAANLAGTPAMSLPIGVGSEGLPIGVQLIANHFCENKLLSTAQFLEGLMGFSKEWSRAFY